MKIPANLYGWCHVHPKLPIVVTDFHGGGEVTRTLYTVKLRKPSAGVKRCKRCQSVEKADVDPAWLKPIAKR